MLSQKQSQGGVDIGVGVFYIFKLNRIHDRPIHSFVVCDK
jgi:hypothetical protein